jgi:hypothetical protein
LVTLSLAIGAVGLIAVWFILSSKDRRLMIDLVPGRFRALAMRLLPV